MKNQPLVVFNILTFVCAATAAALPEAAWAKRTVLGYVKERGTGRPVAGLVVQAWDDDPDIKGVSQDDFMGSAQTNAQGYYEIHYREGEWDPTPSHRVTIWRPDIFIKVFAKSALTGDLVKVYESSTRSDQRVRDDLRIDAAIPQSQIVARRTQFNPIWHGWQFVNESRKICAAPTCDQENWAAGITRRVTTFRWALCGGMSLSALRRFQNGNPVAPYSPQVKEELVRAQVDTVGPTVWAKFLEWQAKPTKPHTLGAHTIGAGTKDEWPKLQRAIDSGAPTVLGLIRVQADNLAGLDPVEALQYAGSNHQVLAIGYDYHSLTKDAVVWAYDPNFPNSLSKISLNLGLPENQIKIAQRTYGIAPNQGLAVSSDNIRGFFVIGDGSAPPRRQVVQPTAQQQAVFQQLVALLKGKDAGQAMTR